MGTRPAGIITSQVLQISDRYVVHLKVTSYCVSTIILKEIFKKKDLCQSLPSFSGLYQAGVAATRPPARTYRVKHTLTFSDTPKAWLNIMRL